MSLNDVMSGGRQKKKLSIADIRMNTLNNYEEENIEELAYQIKRDGQLSNMLVYSDDLGDGKHYTLLGGHRRYLAISMLLENGERDDDLVDVYVVPKPQTELDEVILIQSDNSQRVKTKDEIRWEIQNALKLWDKLVSEGNPPTLREGERKRDWIGKQVGLKGRQVQEYLSGRFSEQAQTNETSNSSSSNNEDREATINDVKKNLRKINKLLLKVEEQTSDLELYATQREIQTMLVQINNMLSGMTE